MKACRIFALLCMLTVCFLSLASCGAGGQNSGTPTTSSSEEEKTDNPEIQLKASGTLLALGDSITYGTKLAGNVSDSYAKGVADAIGYEYENCAKAGSEAYAWYSVLTGKSAPNGTKYTDVGGIRRDELTAYIEDSDIIVFTLGTNDLAYTQWRTVEQIKTTLLGFIDKIHEINSEATVVLVGSGHIFKYDGKEADDTLKANAAELAAGLGEALSGEKYAPFAHFVDVTDIFSDTASFEDVDGTPDYLHPGYSAHAKMAKAVLECLGVE